MALRLRPLLRATALLSALVAVACGSGGSSTPTAHSTARPGGTTPTASPPFSTTSTSTTTHTTANPNGTYNVTVSLTGTDLAQGSFAQPVDPGGSRCQPPSQLSGSVGGQHVQAQFAGAPSATPQTLSPGDLLLTVGTHTWGVASAANAPHGTSGTLQRNSDGSGSAQFQNLALQTNFAQQPQESGSITWTCS
ncbi:MAG: hypothetical protein JOZ75_03790 [Candidatus Dormibacteraeota bacterium]|nr:hypothetical protein [Candidatus Dormibacteraeota bacterium]